jgi:subtilisin
MVRNRSISILLVCVCLSLSLLAGGASAATEEDRRKIVTPAPGVLLDLLVPVILATASEIVHTITFIDPDALAIRLPDLPLDALEEIVDSLLSNPLVGEVDDDIVGAAAEVTPTATADTAADGKTEAWEWGAVHIGVPEVQQQQPTPDGAGVTVAVMDTGIDCDHFELRANIAPYPGFSAFRGKDPCHDDNGHGTHVAGIIAALSNQEGVIGVAPKTKLVSVKVLNQNAQAFATDIVAGLQWISTKGIKVINMSWGFYTGNTQLKKAIERLYKNRTIMVASAGNCGPKPQWEQDEGGGDGGGGEPASGVCDDSSPDNFKMTYPAAYTQVIAVAASDIYDQVAYYSRRGRVDVTAPGGTNATGPVRSTAPGDVYALKTGTSMAAPHVTGSVALVLQRKPSYSPEQVRSLLRETALPLIEDPSTGTPYPDDEQGAGLIDVVGVLEALQ